MPRIYTPQQTDSRGIQHIGGASSEAVRVGMAISGISASEQKQYEDGRFLIDASQFEMDKIQAVENIEQNARYDAATGVTFLGDTPIEGSIADYTMKMFNERVAPIEKKYGVRGKEWAAQKRVQTFAAATNFNSRITQSGNIEHYEKFIQFSAAGIESGASSFEEVMTMNEAALNALPMSNEARQQSREFSNNYITEAMFNRDMKMSPSLAISRVNSKFYTSATPQMQDRFATEVDSYIKGEAMKEAQAAMEAASIGMKHSPNKNVVSYAKQRGMNDVAALVEVAQRKAAMIDEVTSGNLLVGSSRVNSLMNDAISSQSPEKYALAQEMQKAITNKTNVVINSPRTALLWEGIETKADNYSDPVDLVLNRRDISLKAKDKFNIEPKFLGESAPVIVDIVSKLPAGQRAQTLMHYVSPMNDNEKSMSSIELRDISPRTAVVMTLPSSKIELGNQILSDVDMAYMPKDTKFAPVVLEIDSDVEWGDVNAKNAVIEAAKNVYAYRAKMNNWNAEGVESDEFKKAVEEIAGKPISFGAGKATNFYTDSGEFADVDVAKSSLEYAVDSGNMPDAYDSNSKPIKVNKITESGRLVPTGENGKYYVVRYGIEGKEHYRNADGTYYVVDLKDITNKYGGSDKKKNNSLYNKIMSGDIF